MLELITYPAIIANVYYWFLTEPGDLLDFIPRWFQNLPEKLRKPLFQCLQCVTGQMALWSNVGFAIYYEWYNVPQIIFNIAASILLAFVIGKGIGWLMEL